MVRTSDPAAELMQLGESETVSTIDHDRVGGWHIDAALNNRRAEKDVEAAMVKVEHDLLEFALRHLTVGDSNRCFGNEFAESFSDCSDVFDTIVNKVHLSATFYFTQERLANQHIIPLCYECLDCQALGRWSCNQ